MRRRLLSSGLPAEGEPDVGVAQQGSRILLAAGTGTGNAVRRPIFEHMTK